MWKIWLQKDRLLLTSQKTQHRVKQEEKEVGGKADGKFDILKVKCYNCNQLGHFTKHCPLPDKRIKKEEDQYQPSASTMICMNEEKDNAQAEEVTQSEEKEDVQNNVQDDVQVPMTFEKCQ